MSTVAGCRLVGLFVMLCALAAALPAAASAAPSWHGLADAPGNTSSIASGDGRTYVAYVRNDLVHVDVLTDLGWQQVGGVVAHDPRQTGSAPSITVAADGHPWIVWVEDDATDVGRARVARFGHGSWHEIPGGPMPINKGRSYGDGFTSSAHKPRLAFAGGRVFVGYTEFDGVEEVVNIARLRADSSGWDQVGHSQNSGTFRMASAGGRLYFSGQPSPAFQNPDGIDDAELERLKADGSGFERVPFPVRGATAEDLANLDGSLGVLYSVQGQTGRRVTRLDSAGNWTSLDGVLPFRAGSLTAVGGTPYVAGRTSPSNEATENIGVARFEGGAWKPLPSPGAVNNGGAVRLVDVKGAPWVTYQTGGRHAVEAFGEERPDLPDGVDPVKPERGDCGFLKRGGAFSDALVGTGARDTLFGFAGSDWLFGRGGRDCLHGGRGGDRVYGGPHTDFVFGDGGRDRLHGGKGHDVIYGGSGADLIFPERGRDDVAARSGNDTIRAVRGSVDHVNCGRGRDVLYASRNDGWRNCERVVISR